MHLTRKITRENMERQIRLDEERSRREDRMYQLQMLEIEERRAEREQRRFEFEALMKDKK